METPRRKTGDLGPDPGHDAYWYYRDSFFGHFVPPPGRRCLEIGCGEGRVARDLAARGHQVIGIDSSRTLVGYSRREHADGTYLQADAAALPFRGGGSQMEPSSHVLLVSAVKTQPPARQFRQGG